MTTERFVVPLWVEEIERTRLACQQFLITGNVFDLVPVPRGDLNVLVGDAPAALAASLEQTGIGLVLVAHVALGGVEIVAGTRAQARAVDDDMPVLRFGDTPEERRARAREAGGDPLEPMSVRRLIASAANADEPVALIIRDAHALFRRPEMLSQDEHRLVSYAQALGAQPPGPAPNPIIWMAPELADVPPALTQVPGLRVLSIGLPTDRLRRSCARQLLGGDVDASEDLVRETHDARLRDLRDIAELAGELDLSILEAARLYRSGNVEPPFGDVEAAVDRLAQVLPGRVLGQAHAVRQILRVLRGSLGRRQKAGSTKPLTFLFLGPTGVGKTETGRIFAEILAGSVDALVRFNLNEFAGAEDRYRLLGAAPGFVGHERGGELPNAVRQRDSVVILLDEIEKAHPELMLTLMDVLDTGRLTDGRGVTTTFERAIIIMTSNAGVTRGDRDGSRVVSHRDAIRDPSEARELIEAEFRRQIRREELVSRIMQNTIVFDHVDPLVGAEIAALHLDQELARQRVDDELEISVTAAARAGLLELVPERAVGGGRAIEQLMVGAVRSGVGELMAHTRRAELQRRPIVFDRVEISEGRAVLMPAADALARHSGAG